MKTLFPIIIATSVLFSANTQYSTTAVVTLVGAKIAASQNNVVPEKYKRKDCPVCKGKGWYISGDGIKKIDCQYCEPENKDLTATIDYQ